MQTDDLVLAGRYRVDKEIAAGGMGTVYRVVDERLHRAVALKLLKDHLVGDERALERFRREARAVAALSHGNIAQLYDLCEDEGRHFIVMELVEGRDLAALLRDEGALNPERARVVATQVCRALSQAHSLQIVHRDIKPANILIRDDDLVKVTDFGIARVADAATLTGTGTFLGTINYVAPEVADGRPATAASDIYSLGIVLFEMLTGFPPFEADSPMAVAAMHKESDVPLPSTRRSDVPDYLDAAVQKATAKNPDDRFETAADFEEHLDSGGSATALMPPTLDRAALSAETVATRVREEDTAATRAIARVDDTSVGHRSTAQRLPMPSRSWLIGFALLATVLLIAILSEVLSPDPIGVESRTAERQSDTAPTTKVSDLPAPLERALQKLEAEVRP